MYRRRKIEEHRTLYALGSVVIMCGALYLVFNIIDAWGKYKESNRRLEASVIEITHLETQYAELQDEKAHASSTTGIEEQIRSKFDLAKPEEKVVFISSDEPEVPQKEEKGFKKIFDSFKKIFN
jgi:hypothetical protein